MSDGLYQSRPFFLKTFLVFSFSFFFSLATYFSFLDHFSRFITIINKPLSLFFWGESSSARTSFFSFVFPRFFLLLDEKKKNHTSKYFPPTKEKEVLMSGIKFKRFFIFRGMWIFLGSFLAVSFWFFSFSFLYLLIYLFSYFWEVLTISKH